MVGQGVEFGGESLGLTLAAAGVAGAWIGLVGGVAWWLHRQPHIKPEWVRKTVHIGTGNVILIAWALNIPLWVGVAASVLFSGLAILSYYLPILPGINSVGRRSGGTFFYALSIGILVAWFWPLHLPQLAALGILVMTWGDGLAALVGQRWGRHPYVLWGQRKSWEGSLTMLGVSYGVGLGVLSTLGLGWGMTALVAGGVAIVATGLEAFSWWGMDNLTVPLGSAAAGFWLLSQVAHWPLV